MFVNSLHPALDTQLDSMTEDEEGTCTAHDIVQHVTHKILNEMLELTESSPLDLVISNKDMMRVEVSFTEHT